MKSNQKSNQKLTLKQLNAQKIVAFARILLASASYLFWGGNA